MSIAESPSGSQNKSSLLLAWIYLNEIQWSGLIEERSSLSSGRTISAKSCFSGKNIFYNSNILKLFDPDLQFNSSADVYEVHILNVVENTAI